MSKAAFQGVVANIINGHELDRMVGQRLFHLARGDIFAAANDDVLFASGDRKVILQVQYPYISGSEPTIVDEGFVVQGLVCITNKKFGSRRQNFAGLAARHIATVVVNDSDAGMRNNAAVGGSA